MHTPPKKRRYNSYRFPSRRYYPTRNFDDPTYKEWRKKVYARDGYKCQWLGCKSSKKLNAHHILKWSSYPRHRFDVSNGITLCKYHHDQIRGQEEYYVRYFMRVLEKKLANRINRINKRKNTDGSQDSS